jgi:serine/threonine protein kinase
VDGVFAGTDRFVIERQLGIGSMGAVYLAYDRKLESRVALKVLLTVDATSIYRFKKEFRALADVTHPNLVTLHELFSEGEQWFFTMEYVEGKDLLTFAHGARRRAFASTPRPISDLPPDDATGGEFFEHPVRGLEMLFPTPLENEDRLRGALVQVVEGLIAVHAAGKLHRDLKPENVLVTAEGRAVVLDFGIAVDQQKDIHETLATIIGTPAYMSPEQCRGQDVTEATDWYALGVILYEALTGDVPFDGTPMQVISRKQEVDPAPPSEVVSGIPSDLNELCMQLLQRDPQKRPDGEAVLRALRGKRAASLPVPSKAEPHKPGKPVFVGRDAQLRELDAALSHTGAGHPVVALVHGPAGIGKSTLVDQFIEELAEAEHAIVLQGRCYERESVPFKAFDSVIDSLSRYLRRLPAVDAARMMPRDVDALATLFPVLRRVEVVKRNRRPRALPPEPQELRQRAFRALKEMFCRIADLEPLVVYVDDMQWSDVDSVKLVGELLTGSERPALLFICAFRSGEAEQNSGLSALLEQVNLNAELEVRNLPVGALSLEETNILARELLGPGTPEEGARKISFESGGSPHMLAQLVRHVSERRASGRASPDTQRALMSFERVLEQRLSTLSSDARTLLELLSVAGRPVPETMLTLVSSFNIDLGTALAELRAAKLVRGVSVHQVRAVEVFHDTIREGVTRAMTVDVLVSWHRRLAAALEATGAIDLEALTDHLLGAGDRERASLYAARAAAQAENGLAFDKAARLYGVAAEHCPDKEQKRELLQHWADALVGAGRGTAAARAYVSAAQLAPIELATELKARAGVQLLLGGELEQGLSMLQQPLAALGIELPASPEQAREQARAAWHAMRARGLAFEERSEDAIDKAELARLDLLWGAARGLLLHDIARPMPLLIRLLRDALSAGEPLRIGRALALYHVAVDIPLSRAERTATSGALDIAEALGRRMDQVEARALIAYAKGMSVYYDGQLDVAMPELARAEDLLRNHCRGGAVEMRMSRFAIAQAQVMVEHDTDAHLLREWAREAEDRGDRISSSMLRVLLAMTQLRSDQADAAINGLDALTNAAGGTLLGPSAACEPIARASANLYRGNADGCRACYYLLEEFFGTALCAMPVWRGVVLLLRARLSLIARASAGANRNFLREASEALAEVEALELPCFATDALLLRAAIAVAEGHRDEALAALAAVLAMPHDPAQAQLALLCARRAHGQVLGGATGEAIAAAADDLLLQRGVVNPRRFARLLLPGVEELTTRPSEITTRGP